MAQIINHSHQIHCVQTPILLFPSWRRRIAAIRIGAHSDIFTANESYRKRSVSSIRSIDEEPCCLRVQQMLIDDYVAYLSSIGLSQLHVQYAY
jgi:hypothetical protein